MYYSLIGISSAVLLFILMFAFIAFGFNLGKRKITTSGLSVTEGAVFTLMALLVAFTFTSANQRFDQRRLTMIEEANAISTAYLRLDILQAPDRKILKRDFNSYVNSRLAIYRAVPDFNAVDIAIKDSNKIQNKLWQDAITATKNNVSIPITPMMILPAINTMFDIGNTRISYTYIHPHILVFVLLIIVALLSALLTGYGMTGKGAWGSLHVFTFVLITTITIYIIIDLEYPRLGMIKETQFDSLLIDLQAKMQNDNA